MHNTTTCNFDGCEKTKHSRGFCQAHYKQYMQGKELAPLRPKTPEKHRAPKGSPLDVRLAMSTRKNPDTGCWEWIASKGRGGYGIVGFEGKILKAHRAAWENANGPIPDGKHVDHVCRVRHCVNPSHMRLVSNKQNSEHLASTNPNSYSGFRGVSRKVNRSGTLSWVARVTHHGQRYPLGTFKTPEEAAEAARLKRLELFTHNELDKL